MRCLPPVLFLVLTGGVVPSTACRGNGPSTDATSAGETKGLSAENEETPLGGWLLILTIPERIEPIDVRTTRLTLLVPDDQTIPTPAISFVSSNVPPDKYFKPSGIAQLSDYSSWELRPSVAERLRQACQKAEALPDVPARPRAPKQVSLSEVERALDVLDGCEPREPDELRVILQQAANSARTEGLIFQRNEGATSASYCRGFSYNPRDGTACENMIRTLSWDVLSAQLPRSNVPLSLAYIASVLTLYGTPLSSFTCLGNLRDEVAPCRCAERGDAFRWACSEPATR